MNTDAAAGLHEEIRRLRIRITSLAASPHREHSLDALSADGRTRRQHIRAALAQLADLSLRGRRAGAVSAVPDLGDRVLADQLVVLLLDCAPEYGASAAVTEQVHDLAVDLRRALA
ncbi:hypothetical protein [Brevibacterium luteolum]|uniref:hypothetical protein n=1 Tax=Brevibacterium luteolum TaxID=199591 RepID=UPI00223BD42E|nr:hypothetical protein [Brevibacterium luteolum]MCT1656887.1 hypothetical protein [Brevibacterium luteolum]MCT1873901.1 hypothetical protein [Brevibacterium luteolum]MCT1891208.1 hypothetical protein [Brevibacterium luteolum]MCT1894174.1 hypothetical protein [Brevibacterium luteolum]MCT1921748.1 hypothetical protein [Brevibacterium luteolum]